MTYQIPPEDLERIMDKAGIGERKKAKLRQANHVENGRPKGHGSTPLTVTFDF